MNLFYLDRTFRFPSLKATIAHFEGGLRVIEFEHAVIMIAISVWIDIWPASIEASSFSSLSEHMPASLLGALFGSFGLMRLVALIINGASVVYGPVLRVICSLVGAIFWANMSWSLFLLTLRFGRTPSIGIAVYLILAGFELLAMYRAVTQIDGRSG